MGKHRPLSCAPAPKKPAHKLAGKQAAHASSKASKDPVSSRKLNDTIKALNLPARPAQSHTSLAALARFLGRQLAREAPLREGCDD
jgi:hypothetical protein